MGFVIVPQKQAIMPQKQAISKWRSELTPLLVEALLAKLV
jgi:hypothetical protein